MGNRAVIAIGDKKSAKLGIYLHWNGGRDSVEAMLAATRTLMASHGPDRQYGPARLIQVIGNYMGGTLSLGIGALDDLDCDNGDNGVYYIDPESLKIIGREHAPRPEQKDAEKMAGVLSDCLAKNNAAFFRKEVA